MATIVIENLAADCVLDACAMRRVCGGSFMGKYGLSFPQGPVPAMTSPLAGVGFFNDTPAGEPVFLASESASAPVEQASPQPLVTGFRDTGPTQSKSSMIYRY